MDAVAQRVARTSRLRQVGLGGWRADSDADGAEVARAFGTGEQAGCIAETCPSESARAWQAGWQALCKLRPCGGSERSHMRFFGCGQPNWHGKRTWRGKPSGGAAKQAGVSAWQAHQAGRVREVLWRGTPQASTLCLVALCLLRALAPAHLADVHAPSCPDVRWLDLSRSLLPSWHELSLITCELRQLDTLVLQSVSRDATLRNC